MSGPIPPIAMQHRLLQTLAILAASLAAATTSFGGDGEHQPAAPAHPVPPPAHVFRAIAAERLGVPEAAVHLGAIEGPVGLRGGELLVYAASAMVGLGDERIVVTLDSDGRSIDFDAAVAADRERVRKTSGKFDEHLVRELDRCEPGERVHVIAWLQTPESLEEIRPAYALIVDDALRSGAADHEFVEFHHTQMAIDSAEIVAAVSQAAATRFSQAGFEVLGTERLAPLVFLRANRDELLELQRDSQIVGIQWSGGEYHPRLRSARRTVGARANGNPHGNYGDGAKVAIIEDGRVCDNGFMRHTVHQSMTAPTSQHATSTASCITSIADDDQGIAPLATVFGASSATFSANSSHSSQFQGTVTAIDWAIAQGASILNVSIGATGVSSPAPSAFDRYLDWIARNYARTITVAAGNYRFFATDPGGGYNTIVVGAFDDHGSEGWSDDTMWSESAYANPFTGVESPQVAAPGVEIATLTCGSIFERMVASGTSLSAPIVAGEAAVITAARPALRFWPEAIRAIVMATAWNNIEGASSLSSRDGAGGISVQAAYHVAARGASGSAYGVLSYASFDVFGTREVLRGYAHAGRKVRVALSWNSTPTGGPTYSSNPRLADFDVFIYRPDGWVVAVSANVWQPFEVAEFTAPMSGTYTVKVRRRFMSGSEFFGVAMSVDTDVD